MKDYVALYGEKTWSYSTFNSNCALIANYIVPIIGDREMKEITPREADKYIKTLQKTQPVEVGGRRRKTEYMTPANIEKVVKLLRSAFKQAVRWEVIARNPFDFVTLPKVERKPREIWTAEIIRKALDSCKDAKLFVAMNLAFACSLRVGEILGLTWDNVNISDEDIAKDNASVYVDRELFRASKEVMDTLGNRDILFVFPPVMGCPKTRLILKTPKTATSVRRVWLPKTLVCFDIKELGKQLKSLGMLVIQDQVWNRVSQNRDQGKSTWYFVDEFHLLLRGEVGSWSVEIWKRFRKWGGIPTGITQNIKDLLSSPEIENIFENSDFVYLLNQASGDRKILCERLNISNQQAAHISNAGPGEGLIFFGNVILPFVDDFPKDNELYSIMTTKLGETGKGENEHE